MILRWTKWSRREYPGLMFEAESEIPMLLRHNCEEAAKTVVKALKVLPLGRFRSFLKIEGRWAPDAGVGLMIHSQRRCGEKETINFRYHVGVMGCCQWPCECHVEDWIHCLLIVEAGSKLKQSYEEMGCWNCVI